MPTRNIVLTEHQHEFIDALVRSGRYQNASEVLREGLRLVEERDQRQAASLAALRAAIRVGLDDLTAGEHDDVDINDLAHYISTLHPGTADQASA